MWSNRFAEFPMSSFTWEILQKTNEEVKLVAGEKKTGIEHAGRKEWKKGWKKMEGEGKKRGMEVTVREGFPSVACVVRRSLSLSQAHGVLGKPAHSFGAYSRLAVSSIFVRATLVSPINIRTGVCRRDQTVCWLSSAEGGASERKEKRRGLTNRRKKQLRFISSIELTIKSTIKWTKSKKA